MMITIDPEDVRLSKRERDFRRTIALKLQTDAERRWRDLPSGQAWRCGSIYSGGDHLGGQYPSHNNDGATHDRDENEKRHSSDDELHWSHNKPPVCATKR